MKRLERTLENHVQVRRSPDITEKSTNMNTLIFNNLSKRFLSRFQVDYQLGVFISRSSVNLLKINKLWIMPILQVILNIIELSTFRRSF